MKIIKVPKQKSVDKLKGTPMPICGTGKPNKGLLARWMVVNPTPAEKVFLETWLKVSHLPIKPQAIMLGFIADFYVKHKKVVIEIDGDIHNKQKEYDRQRDCIFLARGFHTIRLANEHVLADPVSVVRSVVTMIDGLERLKPQKRVKRVQLRK